MSAQECLRNTKKMMLVIVGLFISFFFVNAYALPFTITPSPNNPTIIGYGQTVTASFTVQNNTGTQRNGNYVKYLPLNTSVSANGCGSTFNLAPVGKPGSSCTLTLIVTGPVTTGDRDPTHQLMICYPGGITCNGPATPLSIIYNTIKALEITPANGTVPTGLTQQFTLTATLSDLTKMNYTNVAEWSTSNSNIMSINENGVGTAKTQGTTTITARVNGLSTATSVTVGAPVVVAISVTPTNPSVTRAATQQFTAIGTFSDGSTQNITSSVTWKSSNTHFATITSTGLATGVNIGSANITASVGAVTSNVVPLTILPPILVSIAVTPTTPSILQNATQQFTAIGTYSDGTTVNITNAVTWLSSNPTAATINSSGLATGVTPTSITAVPNITATQGTVVSNAVPLIVQPILTSIAVTPLNPNTNKGLTIQFTAIGTYSDGSTQNLTSSVTWQSSYPANGVINPAGLATAVNVGSTTITASLGSITSDDALFTILPAILTSVSVTPISSSILQNATVQFTAKAVYSDGTTTNVTSLATWSSTDSSVVSVNSSGLATGVAPTTIHPIPNISATYQNITSNLVPVSVTPILVSINVTPSSFISIPLGLTQQYTAIGTYSDNTTVDLTTSAAWNSSNTDAATVNSSGLVTTVATGFTAITAVSGSVTSNSAFIIVDNPALVSITISPLNATAPKGFPVQYTATGTYTDHSTQNITSSVNWVSSNTSAATINSAGLLTPAAPFGTTTITASSGSVTSGSTSFSVSAYAYITSYNTSSIKICPINSNGTFGTCTNSGNFTTTTAIAVNKTSTFLYVLDNTFINYCALNQDGSLGTCTAVNSGSFSGGTSIAINPTGTGLYVADAANVFYCPINSNGSVGSCTGLGTTNNGQQISLINPGSTYAFVPTNIGTTGSNISSCPVQAGGTLGACTSYFFQSNVFYYGTAINVPNNLLYVTNGTDNVYLCPFNSSGVLGSCSTSAQTFPGSPYRIVLDSTNTHAYIVEVNSMDVQSCTLNNDGSFNTCQVVSTGGSTNLYNGLAISS